MKAYNQLELACSAARRHLARFGGSAAVIQTTDLPGMFQVGTMHEARQIGRTQHITACRLFYAMTDRRHQRYQVAPKFPVVEIETSLLQKRGQSQPSQADE